MIPIEVKTVPAETVAFLPMQGPYHQMPQAMGTLYGWVGRHGYSPTGMPSSVYLTDPASGDEPEWEVHAPVREAGEATPDAEGVGVRTIDAHLVVAGTYHGPYEEMAPVYGDMSQWVHEHGYRMAGPPEEVYFSDPADTTPEEYITEIRFPVEPA